MPESYWKRPAGEADAARAESSSRKIGWTIALIAAGFLVLSRCGYPVRELLEIMLSNHAPRPVQQYAEPIPDAIPTQIVEPQRAEVAIANALAEAESAGAPAERMSANAASEPAAATPPPLIDQGYTPVARTTQDSEPPLAGDAGIEQLLAERTLRPATADDVGRWRKATGYTGSEGQVLGGAEYLHRTYVVQGPMTFPADLYGAHSVTVIVPRGVPRPTGNPGHSHILDMNQ